MAQRHASLVAAMLALASVGPTTRAAAPTVTTILGTGVPGYSNTQVNNPYGIILGPDGAIYFCDLENQRIRRLDRKTKSPRSPGVETRATAATVGPPYGRRSTCRTKSSSTAPGTCT